MRSIADTPTRPELPAEWTRPSLAEWRASRAPVEPVVVRIASPLAVERVHVEVGRALAQLARRRDDAIEAGEHATLTESAGSITFTTEV